MISVMHSDGCNCDRLKHETERLRQELEQIRSGLEVLQDILVRQDSCLDDPIREDQIRYLTSRIMGIEDENKILKSRLEQMELHVCDLNKVICRLRDARPRLTDSNLLVA
jgi:predicted RNase H-like nuclease (RuvC/YqgF family)